MGIKVLAVVLLTQMIYVKIWWKFRSCDGPVAQDTRECAHDQVLLFHVFIFVLNFFSEKQNGFSLCKFPYVV